MVSQLEHRTVDRKDGSSPPAAVTKFGQFSFTPFLGRDTKSRWFPLPAVYAKGSKTSSHLERKNENRPLLC